MSNNNKDAIQDKPDSVDEGEDAWRAREDAENDRWESYAEQDQYRNTDFQPAAGWY